MSLGTGREGNRPLDGAKARARGIGRAAHRSSRPRKGGLPRAMPILAGVILFFGGWFPSQAQSGGRPLYVVTHVDVTPNFTADTAALLLRFATDSRQDSGSVRFEVMQEAPHPNHFTLVEVWLTRRAFESHLRAAHSLQFREKLQTMLGSPFDERLNVLMR